MWFSIFLLSVIPLSFSNMAPTTLNIFAFPTSLFPCWASCLCRYHSQLWDNNTPCQILLPCPRHKHSPHNLKIFVQKNCTSFPWQRTVHAKVSCSTRRRMGWVSLILSALVLGIENPTLCGSSGDSTHAAQMVALHLCCQWGSADFLQVCYCVEPERSGKGVAHSWLSIFVLENCENLGQ